MEVTDDEKYDAGDEILREKFPDFDAVDSELDGTTVKYFDDLMNVVVVDYVTREAIYFPANEA